MANTMEVFVNIYKDGIIMNQMLFYLVPTCMLLIKILKDGDSHMFKDSYYISDIFLFSICSSFLNGPHQ